MIQFIKLDKVCQAWQSLSKVTKFDEAFQVWESLSKFTKFIWMLPGMICENVCNSLANNDDITKLAAIILIQATLNFQNVYDSLGNNNSFYSNDENSLRFKGNSWESLDENHEKRGHNDKKHPLSGSVFIQGFSFKVVEMCTGPKRKRPDVVHLAQL